MTLVSGWGRFPVVDSDVLRPRSFEAVGDAVVTGSVARGNGRAYGDAAIGAVRTIGMTGFDRIRSFDPATGRIRLEAGVLLADLIDTFGPRGFLPFVVPGTRFVSVGGAIAADVHGKNHHCEGASAAMSRASCCAPGRARPSRSRANKIPMPSSRPSAAWASPA